MIKQLFLLFILSTQMAYSSSCELPFLGNYQKNALDAIKKVRRQSFSKLRKSILNAKDNREKLNLIEDQYDLISNIIANKDQEIKILITSQKLEQEQIEVLYRELYLEVMSEYKEHVNFIINQSEKLMKEAGVGVQVRFRNYGDGVRVKFLEFKPNEKSNSYANNILNKYIKAMDTDVVTFDFFENIQAGSAGFSMAKIRRIDLGIRGIRNIVLSDMITMVGKHEFKHGGFARMRAQGKDSIYHPQYIASKDVPLSSTDASIYNRYMSAEEIYNYINNPYWASARIKNINSFDQKDFLNDLSGISSYIKSTDKILAQSEEISGFFIKLLKEADIADDAKITINFLDNDYRIVQSIEDVTSIAITDKKTGLALNDFATKELEAPIKEILEQRYKLRLKYTKELEKLSPEKEADLKKFEAINKRFHQEEISLTQSSYDQIIEALLKKQVMLNNVSSRMLTQNENLLKLTDDFITDVKADLAKEVDIKSTPMWQQRFKEMAQHYQDFGKLAREDYKGFIAIDLK